MNIIEAVHHPKLFRRYLAPDGDLSSWSNWLVMLRALYGLPCDSEPHDDANNDEHEIDSTHIIPPVEFGELVKLNTGRDADKLPSDGFRESLLLCGRRSGKSKVIGLVAAFEAVLGDGRQRLSPGEIGMVSVISPTRTQSRIVHEYIRSALTCTPVLAQEVIREERDRFVLRSGVEVVVMTGDPKVVRGFSLIACVIDECAFFGLSDESKVRNDTELIRSVRPSLGTTGGRLLSISTPYRAAGYVYESFQKHFGNDDSDVLVWSSPSTEMNPTLSASVVERALAEDPEAARCEYVTERGVFRTDVDDFVPRQIVEACVVKGRTQLEPKAGTAYKAFCDMSGGMIDDAALAIGHMDGRTVVLDLVRRWPSPHKPQRVVAEMCDVIRKYGCDRIVGDWYSASWVKSEFENHGIGYHRSEKSVWNSASNSWHRVRADKSQLFLELLPWLHSGGLELPDDRKLVSQLSSLQRFARQVGKDRIDHAPGAHDDLANCVAGCVHSCAQKTIMAGSVGEPKAPIDDRDNDQLEQYVASQRTRRMQIRDDHDPDWSTLQIGPEMPLF